jgi:hypothetical protein
MSLCFIKIKLTYSVVLFEGALYILVKRID